ncbi:MAG: DUF4430 domain-containing protein [Phycisphaeraceae bacterium]
MRYLQRHAEVETSYGGKFVKAIDGVATSDSDDRRRDWFYYVNGIEADTGAAERELAAGDRVWWDFRDWGTAMRVPAVVGSYPEPFVHGEQGKRFPVRIDCGPGSSGACERVVDQLDRAGVAASTAAIGSVTGENVLRLVVGTWNEVRRDGAARQLEQGPRRSGVYARPVASSTNGYVFDLLDQRGGVARTLAAGGGLIAATRFEEQAPTWVVSGTDRSGLDQAVEQLTEKALRNRFAVASDGKAIALPVAPEGEER